MKIAFIYNHFPSSLLTKLFTGSTCYHVAFVDLEHNKMYDMNLLYRRRNWEGQYDPKNVVLVETPVPVTSQFLENKLDTMEAVYGVLDYCLFALRPFYHLFGKSTRNAKGVICSELVYQFLKENGWNIVFNEVPSPADLEKHLLGKK